MAEESQKLKVEQIREVLADITAVFVDRQDDAAVGLLGDREVKRAFVLPVSRGEEGFDDLTSYLELYTATKNNDPQRFVEDLVIQGTTLVDKWRHAYTYRIQRQNPDDPRDTQHLLVQVLRKGYIEELVVGGALVWTEARIEKNLDITAGANTATAYVGGDDPERFITVYWPNVSPFKVKAITDTIFALTTGTFTPVIKGDSSYGNAYHRLGVGHVIENDGSATIRLMLAKPQFVLDAYTTYLTGRQMDVTYIWNVPKQLAQPILDAFKIGGAYSGKGRSATVNYSTNQMLVDIILYAKDYTGDTLLNEITFKNCDATEVTSYYWGIDDPTDYDIPVSVPVGYTYWKNITNNGDGSYDVIIRYRLVSKREYWMPTTDEGGDTFQEKFDDDPTPVTTEMKAVEHSETSLLKEAQQFGITDDSDILDLDTAIQGYIKRQSIRIRDDCSKDVTTQIRGSYSRDEEVTWDTKNGEAYLFIFINYNDTELDALKAGAIADLDSTTNNTVSINFNEDGTFSGYIRKDPYKNIFYNIYDDGPEDYYDQKFFRGTDKKHYRYTLGRMVGSLADCRTYANLSCHTPPDVIGQPTSPARAGRVQRLTGRADTYIGWKETWEVLNAQGESAPLANFYDIGTPILPGPVTGPGP